MRDTVYLRLFVWKYEPRCDTQVIRDGDPCLTYSETTDASIGQDD